MCLFRFLEEYRKFNLSFWAVTTGNEPSAGQMTNYSFQALGFTPETQRDWVIMDLGPALHASPFADTRVIILDDNRLLLPHWAKVVRGRPIGCIRFEQKMCEDQHIGE